MDSSTVMEKAEQEKLNNWLHLGCFSPTDFIFGTKVQSNKTFNDSSADDLDQATNTTEGVLPLFKVN